MAALVATAATGRAWVLALLVGLISATAYVPGLGGSFHFDDFSNIDDVPALHIETLSLQALAEAYSDGFLASRPLANLSFALDWNRGLGAARAFIQTNIALHALNAAIAFLVLARLLALTPRFAVRNRGPALAALAALLWALHPIQVQSVLYVVQRMNEIAALGVLISVWGYLIARTGGRPALVLGGLSMAVAGAGIGLMGKQNAIIAPALWLLLEIVCRRLPLARPRWVLPFFLALAGAGAIFLVAERAWVAGVLFGDYGGRDFTRVERLLTQPRVILFHLGQYFWPLPERFSLEHDFEVSRSLLQPWTTLPALLALVLAAVGAIWAGRRWDTPLPLLAVGWLLIGLSVESSLINLEMVFEHRLYLPSLALAAAVVLVGDRLIGSQPRFAAAAAAMLIAVLAAATVTRAATWRDEPTLYRHALKHAPGKGRVYANLGALSHRLEPEQAKSWLLRATELDPGESVAWEYLGALALDRGDPAAARPLLQRALSLPRANLRTLYVHFGRLLLLEGQPEAALDMFSRGLAVWFYDLDLLMYGAIAADRAGRCALHEDLRARHAHYRRWHHHSVYTHPADYMAMRCG